MFQFLGPQETYAVAAEVLGERCTFEARSCKFDKKLLWFRCRHILAANGLKLHCTVQAGQASDIPSASPQVCATVGFYLMLSAWLGAVAPSD